MQAYFVQKTCTGPCEEPKRLKLSPCPVELAPPTALHDLRACTELIAFIHTKVNSA